MKRLLRKQQLSLRLNKLSSKGSSVIKKSKLKTLFNKFSNTKPVVKIRTQFNKLPKRVKRAVYFFLIFSITFTGTGIIYMFGPWNNKAEAAWFNDNWGYRHQITFTHNADITADRAVTLTLDTAELISAGLMQSDCDDTRFTDPNGYLLKFDLTGTCNNASTTYEVILPKVFNGTNLFYLYYGNPAAVNVEVDSSAYTALTPSGGDPSLTNPTSSGNQERAPAALSYWKFDEGQGTTAQDSMQIANNIPFSAASITYKSEDQCISSKCLYFSGSTGTNYPRLADASQKELDFGTNSFTISAWVRSNLASGTRVQEIAAKDGRNDGSRGFQFGIDSTYRLFFSVTSTGNSADYSTTTAATATALTVNRWHFVALVFTPSTSVKMYKDGIKVAENTSSIPSGVFNNDKSFEIGTNNTGDLLQGYMDEVKVYRQARAEDQIKADYNSRSNPEGLSEQIGGNNQNLPGALSSGLVGYWKLEEAGDATRSDSSGNGNTLTESASDTIAQAAGRFGYGGDFELGDTEFLSAADSSSLSVTGSLTLSAWIKPETVSAGSYNILAKWDGSNESYRLFQNADEIRLELDAANQYVETTTSNLTTGIWYHVVGIYNSSNATAKIFINGSEAASTTTGTIPSSIGDDAGVFQIGAEDTSTSATGYYDGVIDEARIYNRALSPSEISQLYNWAPGPLLYHKMDEASWNGTSNEVIDATGNGYNGTSAGGVTTAPGKYGKSGSFDGSNDIVTFSGPVLSTSHTVMAWIYPIPSSDGYGALFGQDQNVGMYYLGASRKFTFFYAGVDHLSNTAMTENMWHHIAIVNDAGNVTLYLDGVPDGTSSSGPGYTPNNYGDDPQSENFKGKIDEVKAYDYPRTSAQIIEDINAGHPAPGSPAGSPVAWWKFNEGADNTCSGGTNDICNSGSSGSSLDGTLTASSRTTAGKNVGAFDGNGGARRGDIADNANLDFAASEDLSLSLWFKSDSATNPANGSEMIVDKRDSNGTDAIGYAVYAKTTGLTCFGIDDDATSFPEDEACSAADIYDANWHHIVAKKTGTSRLDIYVDGLPKETADTAISATGTLANSGDFWIGDMDSDDNGTSGTEEFAGNIDDVKVFRSALTEAQIKLDMNGSAQQVGSLSSSQTNSNSADAEYCVPGSSATCTAPAGRWEFEESTGSTANDISGNANNGAISGALYDIGKVGKALNYDGTDDVTTVTNASAVDLNTNSGFTYEAWIWADSAGEGSGGQIFNKSTNQTGTDSNYLRVDNLSGSNLDVEANIDLATTDANLNISTAITTNSWNHIVLSYTDDADDEITIYVNGVNKGSSSAGDGSISAESSDLLIGGPTSNNFDGKIDSFRFFGYERSAAQVSWDYNRGAPVAWWKMDECQGTTINDSSGKGITGTATIGSSGTTTIGTCLTSSSLWGGAGGTGSGKRNYAPTFDGTDDKITATYNASTFSGGIDSPQISASVWVKYTTHVDFSGILNHDNGGAGRSWKLGLQGSGLKGFRFDRCVSGPTCQASVSINKEYGDGNWHHVAVTYDNNANPISTMYVDGVLVASSNSFTGTILLSNADFVVGQDTTSSIRYFNGQVDDVRVFNYYLTAAQIKAIYNDGATRYGPASGAP